MRPPLHSTRPRRFARHCLWIGFALVLGGTALGRRPWPGRGPGPVSLVPERSLRRIDSGEFAPVGVRPAPPSGVRAMANHLVNDPAGEPLGRIQSEVSMAVRGDTIVAGWNDSAGLDGGASFCGFGSSTDGGATWVDGGAVPDGPATKLSGDPCVLALPGGRWLYTSVDLGNEDGIALSRGRFRDGVLSWDPPLLYSLAGGEYLDKPYADVDPSTSTIYLTYVNWSQNRGELARSVDGGLTWSEPLVIHESSRANGYIPAAGVDGEVYVVWTARMGEPSSPILVRRAIDGGTSWAGPAAVVTTLGPGSHLPPLCYDREVNATFASIAVDRSAGAHRGRVYVVWTDGESGTFDAFQSWSDDGVRWSPRVRLNDDPHPASVESFWPQVSVGPDGRVTVGWYDRRNGAPEPSLCDFYVAQSVDGGVAWGPNRRLSDASVAWCGVPAEMVPNFGDYVDLVVTEDFIVAGWSDARAGDPDVIAGRIDDRRALLVTIDGRSIDGVAWPVAGAARFTDPLLGPHDRDLASGPLAIQLALAALAVAPPADGVGTTEIVATGAGSRDGGGPGGSLLAIAGARLEGNARLRGPGGARAFTLTAEETAPGRVLLAMETTERDALAGTESRIRDRPADLSLKLTWLIEKAGAGEAILRGNAGGWRVDGRLRLAGEEARELEATVRVDQRVAVSGGGILAVTAIGPGLESARPPFPIITVRAAPNPTRGETWFRGRLSMAIEGELNLYSAEGRRVRTLASRRFDEGEFAVAFDGLDDRGRSLAPGLYIARLESAVLKAGAKLVVVK